MLVVELHQNSKSRRVWKHIRRLHDDGMRDWSTQGLHESRARQQSLAAHSIRTTKSANWKQE